MPFGGFENFEACVRTMTDEEGHDQDAAENICGALQAEAKADNGNVDELLDALERGAGLIADVGVELNSAVDVPAIDSKWVMFKSADDTGEFDHRVEAPHLLQKDADSEKRISYAPAMIPRQPDKEGDVVPTATVERAAHGYLKDDGGVDADHDLIDGKGEPVESWIEPTEREWDLPGGGTETYPPGTWMLGIEWDAETWDRIQSGELEGLSIYGRAEHVDLAKSGATTKTDAGESTEQEPPMTDPDDGGDGGDGLTLKDLHETVTDLAETVTEMDAKIDGDPDGGGADETAKAEDMWDVIEPAAEDLAALEGMDMSTGEIEELLGAALESAMGGEMDDDMAEESTDKELSEETVVTMLAESDAVDADAEQIAEKLGPLFDGMADGTPDEIENESDEDEDEDDDEMDKSADTEDADDSPGANFAKGYGTGGDSAATAKQSGGDSGLPSYQAIAEDNGGN